jgi:thiol-disulfide isomerase/thioredoxin
MKKSRQNVTLCLLVSYLAVFVLPLLFAIRSEAAAPGQQINEAAAPGQQSNDATAPGQQSGDICIALFGAEGCENCQAIRDQLLPGIQARYPQVKVHYFDIDDLKNYQLLVQMEKKYHRQTYESPVFVIGNKILDGRKEIEQHLEEYIKIYARQGGCPLPDFEKSTAGQQAAGAVSSAAQNLPIIYMALFTKPGCKKCDRTQASLKLLKSRYPNLAIKQFDVSKPENIVVQEAMSENVGIPEDQSLLAPMVMVGQDFLAKNTLTYGNMELLVQKYQATGSACSWEKINVRQASSQAYQNIAARFQKLGLLAILGTGLLDGVNPCAFATLIFLISWLAFVGKKKRDLIVVGSSFTLAVFLTYLFIGLGVFQCLKMLNSVKGVRFVVFMSMALVTFIFGVLSIRDYFKVRQGKTREIALQLPKFLKKRIHQVIKERVNVKGIAVAAFFMGAVVSVLELACTGQVYLPIIIAVTGIPSLKLHATLYLILYNLAFVLPLLGIFLIAYKGASSKQLAGILERHMATTKLLTGMFFFLMTAVLIASLYLRL